MEGTARFACREAPFSDVELYRGDSISLRRSGGILISATTDRMIKPRPPQHRCAWKIYHLRQPAYEFLKAHYPQIGPRPSGSPGMETQQKLLPSILKKLGRRCRVSTLPDAHPWTNSLVDMANISS